jgi:hypothetical protein
MKGTETYLMRKNKNSLINLRKDMTNTNGSYLLNASTMVK